MLRAQPTELTRTDENHYAARCQTFDGRTVEFIFSVELNDTNIGSPRELKHQDAFFFVVHDDEGGWSLLKAAAHLDSFDEKRDEQSCAVFQLPSINFRATSIRSIDDNEKYSLYEITFTSNGDSVNRSFKVAGSGRKRSVAFENNSWTASLNGVWWRLDFDDSVDNLLILALVYFDWARNFEYTEAKLKERSKQIPWETIFLQSEKNDERRRLKLSQKPLP